MNIDDALAILAQAEIDDQPVNAVREARRSELLAAISADNDPVTAAQIIAAASLADVKLILARMLRNLRRLNAVVDILIHDKGL